MRPGFSKKASIRRAWRGNIVGRQGGLRIARLGCFWPMPVARAMPCWIVHSICRKDWTNDRERCERAGVPEEQPFATKPQLARQMLKRAFDARVPAAWVTGDSVYGDDRRLRLWLEEQRARLCLGRLGERICLAGWPATPGQNGPGGAGGGGLDPAECRRRGQRPRWYDWRWLPLAHRHAARTGAAGSWSGGV